MILLCLSSICAVLVILLAREIHRTAIYWKNKGIPYESYFSYLWYFLFRQSRVDIFDSLEDYTEKYGSVYGTYQGLSPVLRVSSRESLTEALSKNFSKAHGRTVAAKTGSTLWDNNILVLGYKEWRAVRPLSGHVLTGLKLKQMKPQLERAAERLTTKLRKLAKSNKEISTAEYSHAAVMDGIAAVTFSLEVDALDDPNNVFVKNCTGLFSSSLGLTLMMAFPGLLEYVPFIQFPEKRAEQFFVEFSRTVLEQRRKQGRKSETSDILDSWLEAQETNPEFTDVMLVAQMFVFFLAGFETSAYTLMFIMYLLATHPQKQEEVYQDIIENISDPDNVTFEEYNKMRLVEAAIYETLRLYPTDYVIDRRVVEPCTVAGVPLDKGIAIQVPTSAVNRDPERFHEPTHFKPERFVDGGERIQDVITFGEGPKNCVGQRFAIFQLLIFTVAILRTVRLEPVVNKAYDPSREYQAPIERLPGQMFLPFPKETLKVKLSPRN
ncbi:cytochrome P450 3A24 [Galendromus occidentalis]|uniref:Cytochrome P450 3A24 n=1 Tax=Galendromus occidentalis TaxID=34638 RepID=A0AAJ6QWX0_9ACAR|nr:cytochrome P450 3A24 [Galendromus occidentalis]